MRDVLSNMEELAGSLELGEVVGEFEILAIEESASMGHVSCTGKTPRIREVLSARIVPLGMPRARVA